MRFRLLLLALGSFAMGTDSMVMAGILGLVADDLEVSVSAAGQMVTVFALAYALLAPVLATLTARWPRRRLLLAALALFTVANALSAVAPTYGLLLATRVLAAAGAALYTPSANAVATSLVPPEQRGRALATVMGGLTVATALGVPLGTYVGRVDWRLTMWLVVALGVLAFAGLAAFLRELPAPAASLGLRERLAPLRDRRVVEAAATTFMFFLAINAVYVYLATAVGGATGGDTGRLSVILLVTGVASVAGSWLGGRVVDRVGARAVMLAGGPVAALVYAALPWLGESMPGAVVYAVAAPLAGWVVAVALPHRLASLDPANAPLLISLNSSALYLGIAAGGGAGSIAIALLGERWFPLAATVLAVLATGLAAATTRERPGTVRATAPAAPGAAESGTPSPSGASGRR
ncbi:MFS transporter [Streptomyces cinnamoneus]|uniref:MFS transporter n=1 Tax=Streptomyces cinnamoneus TaxID=53446 RepID=A0A2G1XCA0_STRCJ|nr:MFS transporter [Streptomyces cinnamoneus]PHQ48873.1 MFS transporter [Streptomyces cinnamoneus]PPT14480.1 MFS transporter [Streptomyces cinnamoneus]